MTLWEDSEQGQAVIETAVSLLMFLMVTVGLVDVGRVIFAYNELGAVARYGARWGSVVGGACQDLNYNTSTSDWCDQLGTNSTTFWSQNGNAPLQGAGTSCPSYTSTPADWYTVSSYSGSTTTTIVGALAKHFDSSSSTTNTIWGAFSPGIDTSKLRACIELSGSNPPYPGDHVTVKLYYSFAVAGHLLTSLTTIPVTAQAQWQVEG
jgi:hypothetical protein